jgi:tubulin polyglutamylase TTLL6/13
VQRYIANPYLLDGLKFDLRLYVVVTSCSPLTIFWHKAGLARFATLPYSLPVKTNKDMSQNVHLTNYAVNKDSEHFKISDEDIQAGVSSKRTLETVYARLEKDGVDIALLKLKIADLIIKTLISIQPDLLHSYRMCQPNDRTFNMCFEILGFDVLID